MVCALKNIFKNKIATEIKLYLINNRYVFFNRRVILNNVYYWRSRQAKENQSLTEQR